jgi:hypothetical protein
VLQGRYKGVTRVLKGSSNMCCVQAMLPRKSKRVFVIFRLRCVVVSFRSCLRAVIVVGGVVASGYGVKVLLRETTVWCGGAIVGIAVIVLT